MGVSLGLAVMPLFGVTQVGLHETVLAVVVMTGFALLNMGFMGMWIMWQVRSMRGSLRSALVAFDLQD